MANTATTNAAEIADKSSKPLRLRWNFLWAFIGNSAFSALQFLVMSMLGYFFGGETAQGKYGLATAIVLPLASCMGLQLRPVFVSDIDQRHPFGSYLALRVLTIPLIALGALLWFTLFNWNASAFVILLIVIAFRSMENLTDMLFGVYQKAKRMEHIAVTRVISCVVAAIWAAGAWWFEGSTEVFLVGLLVGQVISLGLYAIPKAKHMEKQLLVFTWSAIWAIFRTAIPMGVVMLLVTLGGVTPRHVIAWLESDPKRSFELVGQFTASTQLIVVQTIFVMALGNALIPDLAQRLQKNPKRFPSLFFLSLFIFTMISLPVAGAIFWYGPFLTKLAFNVEYPAVGDVMRLVGVNAMVTSWVMLVGIANTAGRAFRQLVIAQSTKFVILLVASILFLGHWGLVGGVAAILLANGVTLILSCFFLFQTYRKNLRIRQELEMEAGK